MNFTYVCMSCNPGPIYNQAGFYLHVLSVHGLNLMRDGVPAGTKTDDKPGERAYFVEGAHPFVFVERLVDFPVFNPAEFPAIKSALKAKVKSIKRSQGGFRCNCSLVPAPGNVPGLHKGEK